MRGRSFVVSVLLLISYPAAAVDGVLEINHVCAADTGCFSGDTPGYPVTISNSGSYRLTGNLNVVAAGTSGVTITASNVSLDLNGFVISGPTSCTGSGATLSCTPLGAGHGVDASLSSANTEVSNGSVRGFPVHGLNLPPFANIHDVRSSENGFAGIACGQGCQVTHSMAIRNGYLGIAGSITASDVPNGVLFSGNVVSGNRESGIAATSGGTIASNTVSGNGSLGIAVGGATGAVGTIVQNTVLGNGDDGIWTQVRSTIAGNTVSDNVGDGITVVEASLVNGNTLTGNGGFGLRFVSVVGYEGNLIAGNAGGTVTGGGFELGPNGCDGDTTCP